MSRDTIIEQALAHLHTGEPDDDTIRWILECALVSHAAEARQQALEEAAKIVDEWRNRQTMLLRAGEMSADERRTALAVVVHIAAAIRQRAKETR